MLAILCQFNYFYMEMIVGNLWLLGDYAFTNSSSKSEINLFWINKFLTKLFLKKKDRPGHLQRFPRLLDLLKQVYMIYLNFHTFGSSIFWKKNKTPYLSFRLEKNEFIWKCSISVTVFLQMRREEGGFEHPSGEKYLWVLLVQQLLPCQAHHWYLVCNIFMICEETVNSSIDEHQSEKCFAMH